MSIVITVTATQDVQTGRWAVVAHGGTGSAQGEAKHRLGVEWVAQGLAHDLGYELDYVDLDITYLIARRSSGVKKMRET